MGSQGSGTEAAPKQYRTKQQVTWGVTLVSFISAVTTAGGLFATAEALQKSFNKKLDKLQADINVEIY